CIAVDAFSIDDVSAKLRNEKLTPENHFAADEIYFRDPDGILVQLAAPGYRNPRSEVKPKSASAVEPLFKPLALDHLSLHVSNLERSTALYERLFGGVQRQNDRPMAGFKTKSGQVVGWGTDGISGIGVDHFCIAIDAYEPDAVSAKLKRNG